MVALVKLHIIAMKYPERAAYTKTLWIHDTNFMKNFGRTKWAALSDEEKGWEKDYVWPIFWAYPWLPKASVYLIS